MNLGKLLKTPIIFKIKYIPLFFLFVKMRGGGSYPHYIVVPLINLLTWNGSVDDRRLHGSGSTKPLTWDAYVLVMYFYHFVLIVINRVTYKNK